MFQKSLTPYALVMPDKVDSTTFLPATRSMALRKSVWNELGGFNELYSHNEDYVFARKIRASGKKIVFTKEAIVKWIPRSTLKQAFIMFFRFAYGDAESKQWRPKVVFIFLRYIVGILLLLEYFKTGNISFLFVVVVFLIFYIVWSIVKNYRYVNDYRGFFYLPLFQFTSDIAVLIGTSIGIIKSSK